MMYTLHLIYCKMLMEIIMYSNKAGGFSAAPLKAVNFLLKMRPFLLTCAL